MKRSDLIFDAVLLPLDFVALFAAGAVAYYLRTNAYVQSVRPAVFVLDLPVIEYLQLVTVVVFVIIGVFALQGLYVTQARRRLLDEQTKIFSGISMGFMGVIVYIFLSAELFQSRFILLAAYLLAILFVSLARIGVRRVQVAMLKKGYGVYRVLLVGNGRIGRQLFEMFEKKPQMGYLVVGRSGIARWESLEKVYRDEGIDEVIQTDPTLPVEDTLMLLDFCEQRRIDYKYVPDLFETYAPRVRFRHIGSVPLMELMRTPLEGWGRVAKRMVDLAGSIFGLLLMAIPFLVVAILIKLDSHGPVFYRQTRVGRNTKNFDIYKFRSMRSVYCTGDNYGGKGAARFEDELRNKSNERSSGPLFKMRNDPRVTKVGKILRRTRIDELPQLFNVLVGEMSLVGPRPHLPKEVERYDRHHRRLFTIKPGMTGMAQVQGNAGLPFEQEARFDIGYIENWSFWLDAVLLVKTIRILFTDRNAV